MIKVLHLVPAYLPSKGGIEILVSSLINKFENVNIKNIVITDSKKDKFSKDIINKVDVFSIPFTHHVNSKPFEIRGMLENLAKLREVINWCQPDIFHVHGATFVSSWFAARSIAQHPRLKVVVTQHGALEPGDETKAFKEILNQTDALIGVSDAALESVKKVGEFKGKILKKIVNGAELKEDEKVKWPFDCEIKILMIGRLDFEKGFDIGIDAASKLNKLFKTTVVIIGSGEFEIDFYRQAKILGLELVIISNLENALVQAYIREASFVWVPSRTREGFSLVAAESGLNGIPVICSSTGGLPETVIHGKTGLICNENNSSEFFQNSIKFIEENFDDGFKNATSTSSTIKAISIIRFSLDQCAKKYIEVYEEMIGNATE